MQTKNDTSKPETELKQGSGEGCPGATCSPSSLTPETDEFYKGEKISDDQIFAQKLERERNHYKAAIENCLNWANGRQYEWGDRAENAFAFLEAAMEQIPENARAMTPGATESPLK